MKQRKTTNCRFGLLAVVVALAMACSLALVGCEQGSNDGSGVQAGDGIGSVDQDRMNAKTVIRGASDLFTMVDLGLTDADSGAVISMGDQTYSEFFDELKEYGDIAELDLTDATFTVNISAVEAATARGSQTNYRFAIKEAEVTVNGKTATYNERDGLVVQ